MRIPIRRGGTENRPGLEAWEDFGKENRPESTSSPPRGSQAQMLSGLGYSVFALRATAKRPNSRAELPVGRRVPQSLFRAIKNELIARIGRNQLSVRPIENLVDRSRKSSQRSGSVPFVYAFE